MLAGQRYTPCRSQRPQSLRRCRWQREAQRQQGIHLGFLRRSHFNLIEQCSSGRIPVRTPHLRRHYQPYRTVRAAIRISPQQVRARAIRKKAKSAHRRVSGFVLQERLKLIRNSFPYPVALALCPTVAARDRKLNVFDRIVKQPHPIRSARVPIYFDDGRLERDQFVSTFKLVPQTVDRRLTEAVVFAGSPLCSDVFLSSS